MKIHIYSLVLFFVWPLTSWGKHAGGESQLNSHFPIPARILRIPAEVVKNTPLSQYLIEYIPALSKQEVSLGFIKMTQSLAAKHTHYQLKIHNIPVFGGGVIVSEYPGIQWVQFTIPTFHSLPPKPTEALDLILFWDSIQGFQYARLEQLDDRAAGTCEDRIYSLSGDLLWVAARNAYYTDTTIAVKVFRPDPLTSGGFSYGGTYVDNNDANAPWLDAQLSSQTVPARFDNNLFYLQNDYIRMDDWGAPSILSPTSVTPQFYFNRSDEGFEYANAYFHLSLFRQYVHDLGFNCADNPVEVDAHYGTSDQSFFSAASPPRLQFGDGGVDDAEDADVLIHEYGHCLSFYANNSSNYGNERNAIDESFCDYLAASYSRKFSSFQSDWVFNWDGHNPFWNGRVMNSSKKSPADKTGNIYNDAQILSSGIWGAVQEIGLQTLDSIVLEGIYAMGPNLTLEQAAEIFILADSGLFQGANFCALYRSFFARGLMPYIPGNTCGVQSSLPENPETSDRIRLLSYPQTFTLVFPEIIRNAQIEMYNVAGQCVGAMKKDSQSDPALQTSLLAEGLYWIIVRHDFGQECFRWVKTR